MPLLEEIKQWLANARKKEQGSIMLVTVGLVLIILIVTAAALHWTANLAVNQFRFNATEAQRVEPCNVNDIINAQIRERLMANNSTNTNLYNNTANFLDVLDENLSRNGRPGLQTIGFYLVTNAFTPPTWSNWMTTDPTHFNYNAFKVSTTMRIDNPMAYLWCIPYPDPSTTNKFDIKYQLYYWDGTGAIDPNICDKIPVPPDSSVPANDPSRFFTNSVFIREIPSAQIQLLAIDELDTTRIDGNLALYVNGVAGTNGLAFFPYGIIKGNSVYGSGLYLGSATNSVSYAVASKLTTKPNETTGGSLNCDSKKLILRPNLGVSWMTDPYVLAEADADNNFKAQKYNTKARFIYFNGYDIFADAGLTTKMTCVGMTVEKKYGANRLVIDIAGLPANNGFNNTSCYYIDCVDPLAKQRGILLVGAGAFYRGVDGIFTNGSLRLEGTQSANPLVAGTSYGAVVFTGTIANPVWNAYIVNAGRPPIVIATSDRATYPLEENPYSIDISAGSGTLTLKSAGMNYDTIQVKGTLSNIIGFGYTANPNACWVQINGNIAEVHMMVNGQDQTVGTVSVSSNNLEVTYHRALNAVGISSQSGSVWTKEQYISLNNYVSRIETTQVSWSAASPITIIARSGGSAFYGEESATRAGIKGGVMVGKILSGNLQPLIITPSNSPTEFFTLPVSAGGKPLPLSDRFLLFDP